MRYNGCWVLLGMMFAFAAPLGAEVNQNEAAISAALNSSNSDEALVLIRRSFFALKPDQSTEAKRLLQSILAVTPMELSGKVVVSAIEANPALGNVILSAISDTSQAEQLAILNRVSFAASQEPQSFTLVSSSLPQMLNAADANLSVSQKFTAPDYNPSNVLSETGVTMSPSQPTLHEDRQELRADELQLKEDELQLKIDREEHQSPQVIDQEKAAIEAEKEAIKELEKIIRQKERH
jgi:hypothetical protein